MYNIILLHLYTVLELEVRLATEEEEKKLLQARLDELRDQARQQQEQLRAELEKVHKTNAQKWQLVDNIIIFFFGSVDRQGQEKTRQVSLILGNFSTPVKMSILW